MDETLQRTMLFDFFGELLTEKQREYYNLHYNEDWSLAEISAMTGISRQGVWDIVRRAEAVLMQTEEKTGLVRRYNERRAAVGRIRCEMEKLHDMTTGPAHELSKQILCLIDSLEV